jgi:transcriptional regulator with XRE-family HTH domain
VSIVKAGAEAEIEEWVALLVAERLRLGWSQAELAGKMATGQSAICHWENGVVKPRLAYFFVWAQTLGFDVRMQRRADS